MIPTFIISFLSKPDGGFALFKLNYDSTGYMFVHYEDLPIDKYNQIKVVDLIASINSFFTPSDQVEAFVVKPDGRATDDTKTLFRIGYNTATVKTVLDILRLKVFSIKNSRLWQNYFNIDQTNTKESALSIARELLPDISISSTEQAEAILIGVFGIETVIREKILNKHIGGVKHQIK